MKKRITKPGRNDLPWMLATCAPDSWEVEFYEEEDEAKAALETWLGKGRTGYVGKITLQGEFR